jgi:hypothetical protein
VYKAWLQRNGHIFRTHTGFPMTILARGMYESVGLTEIAGALDLVLHFPNFTMADFSLEQIFGLTPAVSSRYRNWGSLRSPPLRRFSAAQIRWPSDEKCEWLSALIGLRHPRLHKAIGFVDGYQHQRHRTPSYKTPTITAGVRPTSRPIPSSLHPMKGRYMQLLMPLAGWNDAAVSRGIISAAASRYTSGLLDHR